mgnify:CR=1 FL=1
MNEQFDLLIDSYLSNDIGIAPAFLSQQLSAGLQQNIIRLQQNEMMTAAGIGNLAMWHYSNRVPATLDIAHQNFCRACRQIGGVLSATE